MNTQELISKLETLANESEESHPRVAGILFAVCAGLAEDNAGLESIVLASAKASHSFLEKCNRRN